MRSPKTTVSRSRQTEPSANTALGDLLKGMLSGCQARAEHTGLTRAEVRQKKCPRGAS